MKKIIILIFLTFFLNTQVSAINQFRYLKKEISGEFCNNLLNELNFPGFSLGNRKPIIVNTELLIEDINNIEGKTLDFEASFTLWNFWVDEKVVEVLKKMEVYEDTDKPAWLCDFPPQILWGEQRRVFDPVIEFYNRKSKPDFQKGLADWIEIFSNGTIQTRLRDISKFKFYNTDFKQFPFDKQTLEFQLYPEFPIEMVQFKADEPTMSEYKQNLYNFDGESGIEIPGWNLTEVNYFIDQYTDGDYEYQGFIVSLKVERISSYYVSKVILPIFFILLISWSVFWVRGSQLEAKVNITIVCLLALIAYNFIIDEDLPKLSYLTFMDSFILISYFYTGIASMLCIYSFVRFSKTGKDYTLVDYYSRVLGPISYIFAILLLIFIFL